ncbi:hypothetical protein HII31_10456 [Pseudocercospora fuligena]|uniref:Uncharacterized protein n=1 Tax=Pseudocercospora fuligena TaxID=685502 RepID=A0A8H6RBP4_9PEZI|nr:hypothetical protein HII31_10456 [Pseudocercospora fuligena]
MSYVMPSKMKRQAFPAKYLRGDEVQSKIDNTRASIEEVKFSDTLKTWTYRLKGRTDFLEEKKLSFT